MKVQYVAYFCIFWTTSYFSHYGVNGPESDVLSSLPHGGTGAKSAISGYSLHLVL